MANPTPATIAIVHDSLAVEALLFPNEKEAFLEKMTAFNKHWQGAKVADFLSHLDDVDALCGEFEDFFDEHFDRYKGNSNFTRLCFYVAFLICDRNDAKAVANKVNELVTRHYRRQNAEPMK